MPQLDHAAREAVEVSQDRDLSQQGGRALRQGRLQPAEVEQDEGDGVGDHGGHELALCEGGAGQTDGRDREAVGELAQVQGDQVLEAERAPRDDDRGEEGASLELAVVLDEACHRSSS